MFRWSFIGAGRLANRVAKQITKSCRHEIAAVYTRNIEKAKAFAAKFGGVACATAEEALSLGDGVYIVTPHNAHFRFAKLAVEMGVPALVEKPFTVRADEAETLFAHAKGKGVYLAEAMWTWFADPPRTLQTRVKEGKLGQILRAEATYCFNGKTGAPRVLDPKRAGGALLDIGVYPVTYFMRLFGAPQAVRCEGEVRGGVDLNENITLNFGEFEATCRVGIDTLFYHEKLKIEGEQGSAKARFFHTGKSVTVIRGGKRERLGGKWGMLNEFDCVANEIKEGKTASAYAPPEETVAVLRVLDECRKQMGLEYQCEE